MNYYRLNFLHKTVHFCPVVFKPRKQEKIQPVWIGECALIIVIYSHIYRHLQGRMGTSETDLQEGIFEPLEHWLFLRDIKGHAIVLSLNLLAVQELALDQEGFLTAH